ncbi:hypothetical protein ACTI_43070 [Actinoplanes sp. OR16]|uniref:FtsX-like permease family protein n=1 Tax=Actinoplanes sp. OR16 TaxID=946334 RepID=UPI000F6E907C|nr:FtsX-like permease family protein [Actinoplanes sp. OR16]BBH67622.1 hypothetical protein ACTI_43070 [Actinoplanes sp. OR16]
MKLPVIHWPSVWGRARADVVPLLLTALVVVIVTALAGTVPALLRSTADEAVRDAVRRAGDAADITVAARWEPDTGEQGRFRMPRLAEDVDALRDRSLDQLGDELREALLPPVAGAVTPTLKITDGKAPRTLRLGYLSYGGGSPASAGPAVTWTEGSAPGPTVPAADGNVEAPANGPSWQVAIGLSEAAAAQLGVRPGERIPASDDSGGRKNIVVSGVFRPADPADPAWRLAPWLLAPAAGMDGAGTTRFGGLLSADSLPDARLAFKADEMRRTVWFSPNPDVLTLDSAERTARTAVNLKATSASTSSFDTASTWNTQLDAVLRDVRGQVDAAYAQASVLLIAVLTTGVLVLLLAAGLLVRRRTPALAVGRQRGTGLPVLAAELAVESMTVTVASASAGVAVARTVIALASATPEAGAGLAWIAPVVVAAVVASPVLGVVAAARATRDRRAPANRGARRQLARTAQLRRLALELAVVAVAAGAFAALHQRGVRPGAAVALPAAAPTLGVIVGGLILLRLMPLITGLVLRRSLRSRRPLAVFGAARAADRSGAALPLLTMVAAAGLAVYSISMAATVEGGLEDGSWRSVGADARLDLATPGAAPAATVAVAGQAGIRHVVAAQIVEGARIATADVTATPRLVVVDTPALREMLAGTPLSEDITPGDISEMSPGKDAVPALVISSDGSLRRGMRLQLLRDGEPAVPLIAMGTAPPIGGAPDVVLVDATAITAAGAPFEPDTIWATGPGAEQAVAAAAGSTRAGTPAGSSAVVDGDVVLRSEVLRDRRDAPLVSGLRELAWASAAVMLALGLLGFALSAAATAPERSQTLSRLRTIGLRPRDARSVATAEMLPLALAAMLAGPALGLLLTGFTLGPLALRLLTGQSADPLPSPPWPALVLVATLFLLAAVAVAPLEAALRRRQQLSEVLRVGGA